MRSCRGFGSLGINIGTRKIKAAIIEGNAIALEIEDYLPTPMDTEALWSNFVTFVRRISKYYSLLKIRAICVSGRAPTLVGLRGDGLPGPIVGWGNMSSVPKLESFYMDSIAVKLRETNPLTYEKCSLFMNPHEYISYKLTGRAFLSTPSESYHPWGGLWGAAEERLTMHRIDTSKIAPIVKIGSEIGPLTPDASLETGLNSDTLVYMGGWDFMLDMIGSGAFLQHELLIRTGSSVGINYILDREISHPDFYIAPFIQEGTWIIGKVMESHETRDFLGGLGRSLVIELARCVHQLEELTKAKASILFSGGMSFWTDIAQRFADIISREVWRTSSRVSEAIGAGILASVSARLLMDCDLYPISLTSGRTKFSPRFYNMASGLAAKE